MPIDQVIRTNPIEKFPKQEKPAVESDTAISLEAPRVEFGQDQLLEKTKSEGLELAGALAAPAPSRTYGADPRFKKIESILEEDLGDIYFKLDWQKQQEFKTKGEVLTLKIINILAKPKIKIKKIMFLIRDWLKIIPGINKFFLEQTVKIKTDKIIDQIKS